MTVRDAGWLRPSSRHGVAWLWQPLRLSRYEKRVS